MYNLVGCDQLCLPIAKAIAAAQGSLLVNVQRIEDTFGIRHGCVRQYQFVSPNEHPCIISMLEVHAANAIDMRTPRQHLIKSIKHASAIVLSVYIDPAATPNMEVLTAIDTIMAQIRYTSACTKFTGASHRDYFIELTPAESQQLNLSVSDGRCYAIPYLSCIALHPTVDPIRESLRQNMQYFHYLAEQWDSVSYLFADKLLAQYYCQAALDQYCITHGLNVGTLIDPNIFVHHLLSRYRKLSGSKSLNLSLNSSFFQYVQSEVIPELIDIQENVMPFDTWVAQLFQNHATFSRETRQYLTVLRAQKVYRNHNWEESVFPTAIPSYYGPDQILSAIEQLRVIGSSKELFNLPCTWPVFENNTLNKKESFRKWVHGIEIKSAKRCALPSMLTATFTWQIEPGQALGLQPIEFAERMPAGTFIQAVTAAREDQPHLLLYVTISVVLEKDSFFAKRSAITSQAVPVYQAIRNVLLDTALQSIKKCPGSIARSSAEHSQEHLLARRNAQWTVLTQYLT